ncbi:MAG: hypothetical protein JWR61_2408 [Ferruginibacter sp.]|nr:hypothetical protein [Ferruginibacter sp.]
MLLAVKYLLHTAFITFCITKANTEIKYICLLAVFGGKLCLVNCYLLKPVFPN